MPKLLWQHLHTRGWALVHDQAAHCWKVQLSQVSGRQLHGEGGSCLAAAVGCPGLAQCLSPLGPPAGPSLLVWHQLTPAKAVLITGDRKQSEKGNHILSWKPNSLPKVSSSEVSIALLWPISYKNIHAFAERAIAGWTTQSMSGFHLIHLVAFKKKKIILFIIFNCNGHLTDVERLVWC